ncbi:hypothetical protein [Algibacillus agarilyticus]|uniref:hypothetical protein n=1 Tax=Algibacillus agarilyticus TaxID=2234133 RepID=UPI000DD014B6|nr:hypothetical protein [Algibacillus agarilyticus]
MTELSIWTLLSMSLIVGMIHAFDADHVVAMSSFVNHSSKVKAIIGYAFKWGVGHGGTILMLAAVVVLTGFMLPEQWTQYAETAVGAALVILGFRLIYQTPRLQNNGNDQAIQSSLPANRLIPLLMGILQGVAGSTSVISLLPTMSQNEFLGYVALFSFGCLVSMSCLGVGFAYSHELIRNKFTQYAPRVNQFIGLISIGLGSYWLMS